MQNNTNNQGDQKHKTITVYVNEHPVAFSEKEATGLEIKETAIAQGVKIKPDFELFLVKPGEKPKQIADKEKVELKQDEKFHAVSPDDKS